ncbi:MAG TPA: oxidoreductase [Solirubrobacterales bacterium]|nr:oxidoreductase [Solirubrobacterales bacterium]
MADKWNTDSIPDLRGRTALVTGANSGIGLRAAQALAGAGATVLMGCRDRSRGGQAIEQVEAAGSSPDVDLIELDLADLGSIERAATAVAGREGSLDLLINNAGVMATPRMETADGLEMQLGTNHFGHFALTGHLLEKLLAAPAGRVVNVSSTAHRQGQMDFDDLNWERSYSRWPAYGRSKLANLLFTFELDRRLRAVDASLIAAACHPGYSATNLQTTRGGGVVSHLQTALMKVTNLVIAQSDEMGALPTLYAATAPDVEGGDYIGPDGIAEARGHPTKVGCKASARDEGDAVRLWEASVELTGVDYAALG